MTVDSTSSSSTAPLVVNGLISGIDTSSVISALLESYQQPITNLEDQQDTLGTNAGDYQTINTDLQSLLTAADALNTPSSWDLATATSSDTAVASATASPGAQTGSLSFTVDNLAAANVVASTGGVASTGSIVTTASSLLVGVGAEALGLTGLGASGSLGLGSHTIEVSQASSAATVTGSSALPTSTTITTGTNDTLALSVGGQSYTLTLAAGTYSASGLATAINSAAATAEPGAAPITASVGTGGALELSTTEQGSDATLTGLGGDALASLGLSASQTAQGTDAVVSVDGTSTTLSAIDPGATVTLDGPSGAITATVGSSPLAGGSLIGTGSADASLVSTGNGSLADVVSAINNAGLAVTASAVQDSSGTYLLQVGAENTGLAGAATVDGSAFSGGALGGLQTISQAENASVTVGGANGYQLTSETDTFSNLLPGTAVTVAATGSATVTVSPDAAGEAANVSTLVSAANQVLSDIQQYAGYNESTKEGGPLMGSSVLTSIQQEILSSFASAQGTSSLGDSSAAGITVSSSGTLTFDQATFESAYSSDPSSVEDLFTQGGTFSPSSPSDTGAVSFVYAGNDTAAGSYDVVVDQSATQATDLGGVLSGGTTGAAETLDFTQDGQSASYDVSSGESLSAVAAGLNTAFASGGVGLAASVVDGGDQLEVTATSYGAAGDFTATSTASGTGTTGLGGATPDSPVTFSGQDVAGTINGVAATGNGQVLAAPSDDPTLQGLSLLVTASGISSPTTVGTFTYSPGLAQQLATLADSASNASDGTITTTIQGLQSESTGLDGQITNYEALEESQQTLLTNEFATMESTLGSLKNESSELTSELEGDD